MSISLQKGQKISLEKDGAGLKKVFMGLGWDAAPEKSGGLLSRIFGGGKVEKNIDLDASCIMVDADGNVADCVYFGKLRSDDGSVVHTGDNLTGDGEGDDEAIRVNLEDVPPRVKTLVFVVSSYQGQNFGQIENAFCRLVDESNGEEVARYDISGGGSHTGVVMAKVYRHGGQWKMGSIGEWRQARTANDFFRDIRNFI